MEDRFIERKFEAIEGRQAETEHTLDNHTELLNELSDELKKTSLIVQRTFEDVARLNPDMAIVKSKVGRIESEVLKLRESQADFRDKLKEHSEHLGRIETALADHGKHFDGIEGTLATHSERFDGLDSKMDQILALLQKGTP
jgi:chromosome segregation ATPase